MPRVRASSMQLREIDGSSSGDDAVEVAFDSIPARVVKDSSFTTENRESASSDRTPLIDAGGIRVCYN